MKKKKELRRYIGKDVGFQRIRRITGYLVGDMDRLENRKRADVRFLHAKIAEEKDRVKHPLK